MNLGVLQEIPVEGLTLERQNLMIHRKDGLHNELVTAFREFVVGLEWK